MGGGAACPLRRASYARCAMLADITFGPFTPDIVQGGGLVECQNAYPAAHGWRAARGFEPITPALTGWLGGAAFVGPDGTAVLLSGTGSALYSYAGTWTSLLSVSATSWRFAQFGDNIICVNGGAPVTYKISTGVAAATVGSPPASDMVAIVGDHVILAGGADISTVTWSAFNNSEGWTSGTDQSGDQMMLDGGEIMGLAGGEYGIILQRNAIKRMDRADETLVFSFSAISPNVGCMSKGSVAQAGRLVFFLSERGFMLCDGSDVRPIGSEQVDNWFFEQYGREDVAAITSAVDPRRHMVAWAMPDRIIFYNWAMQRWGTIKVPVSGLFGGFIAGASLEGLDADNPSIDAMTVSLDSEAFKGGAPVLYIVSPTGVVGSLTGDYLPARFVTTSLEVFKQRARIRKVRPDSDCASPTVTLRHKIRQDNSETVIAAGGRRQNGDMHIRANGQHWSIEANTSGAWTYFNGVRIYGEPGGYR